MAIIICPECGKEVSDKASTCPHCGISIAELERCPECNKPIIDNMAPCPHCGYDVSVDTKNKMNQENKNKHFEVTNTTGRITITWNEPIIKIERLGMLYFTGDPIGISINSITKPDNLLKGSFTLQFSCMAKNGEQALIEFECQSNEDFERLYNVFKSVIKRKAEMKSLAPETRCPKCGSTNIQVVRKNWSLLAGLATNAVDRVCVNCKYKW